MSSDAVPKPAAPAIYASFRLGEEEFAVDVRHVQEVVRRPGAVVAMPLQPDFALGVFNLRGAIVPLLSMERLLGVPAREPAADAKVAIVHHRGVRLGLTCDDTSRVLRPRGEELALFSYEDRSAQPVVAGVLKLADGLLRVLDLERLLALESVPHTAAALGTDARARAKLQRLRCITFRVGETRMAFPIGGIHEIVLAESIERSPIQDPLCAGVMRIRQRVVPVVRFATLLGRAGAPEAEIGSDSRVIVLATPSGHVGLLVDAVESIDSYTEDQRMAVPVLSRQRAAMFAGCIDFGERGHVFLLDAQGVFLVDEIARITGQHSALFASSMTAAGATAGRAGHRQAYLWFGAGQPFALPMKEIREIVDGRSTLIEVPGAPPFVAGMINLRGRLVTVVDVRRFYRLPPESGDAAGEPKVLVIDQDDTLIGLRVDSVDSILQVPQDDRFALPQVMRIALPAALRNDIREVARASGADGQPVHLLVLNVARVFDTVRAELEPSEAAHA